MSCSVGLAAFRPAVLFAVVFVILELSRLEKKTTCGRLVIVMKLIVIDLVVESVVLDWRVEK